MNNNGLNIRYRPKIDKLYAIITIPTTLLVCGCTVVPSIFAPSTLLITLPVFLLVMYFLATPFFGYAELRESTLFIKYGLLMKKEIPYAKIRGAEIKRSFIAESMMSLKMAFDHVNIKYNTFDLTIVSVKENEDFVTDLKSRITK